MLHNVLISGPDQVAYATNDLKRAMEEFEAILGISRFFQTEGVEMSNQVFQFGSPPLRIDVAIGWTGTNFLEIIRPLTLDVIYGADIDYDGFHLRFHHTAFRVKSWDAAVKDLADRGRRLAFSAEVEGVVKSGYWDGRETLGHYVEFYYLTPAGEDFFDRIRTGDF